MCFRHVLLQFSKQPCARSEFCRTCKSSSKKDGDKLPWIPGCTVCVFLFFACPPEEVSVLSYGIEKVFFVLTGAAKVSSAFLVSSLDSVSLFPCFFLVGQGTPNPWCLMILCVFFYILFCVSLKKERNNKRKKEKQTLCQEWCVLQGGRKEAKRDGKKQGEKTREKERRKENQEERRKQGDRQIKKLE